MQQESSTLKLDCHKRFHRAILFVCTTDFRTNKLQQVTIHSRKPFVRWDGPWIAIANNNINNKLKKRRNNSIKNLSNNNIDGYENVTSKVNSRYFKLYCTYSNSFNSSNVGKFFSSWILKDCIKVQEKKKSFSCAQVLDKTLKYATFTFHIMHLICLPKFCIILVFISPGYYSRPKRNWKQCLCKILEGK